MAIPLSSRCARVTCPSPRITSTGRTASQRELPLWVIDSNRLILKRMGMSGQGRIETSGSMIELMLPKSIHAVVAAGFELKSVLFSCSQHRLPEGGNLGYDSLRDPKAGLDKCREIDIVRLLLAAKAIRSQE
jgi:hypothetical protein